MQELRIPIGRSGFEDIRENGYYYIDKSGLIRELLRTDGRQVTLITRPRRFGKTLGMSMLSEFFDIRKESRELFLGLSIAKDDFYHGMVLGLLQSRSDWLIQSNTELGEGYSDISICTPDKVGVVIELKYMDDGNLEKGCADALLQIKDRKYDVGLRHKGMKEIIKYGIAFSGKECVVVKGQG